MGSPAPACGREGEAEPEGLLRSEVAWEEEGGPRKGRGCGPER